LGAGLCWRFSNFRFGGAETGSIADRERFAGPLQDQAYAGENLPPLPFETVTASSNRFDPTVTLRAALLKVHPVGDAVIYFEKSLDHIARFFGGRQDFICVSRELT
jgi:hypothetical protein